MKYNVNFILYHKPTGSKYRIEIMVNKDEIDNYIKFKEIMEKYGLFKNKSRIEIFYGSENRQEIKENFNDEYFLHEKKENEIFLINCPCCGKEVSNQAESCPNCGCPMLLKNETWQPKEVGSEYEINGVHFDIKEIQQKCFFQSVTNVAKKVRKLCQCEQSKAEEVVYGYFLSTHGDYSESKEELQNKIAHIKSWNGKKLYCPYCLSKNINIRETVSESVSKGKSEVRKKNAVTRAGNKAGRAGMIMMTGGLWALTPKKSDYKETSQGKTTYNTTTTKTCMDCGMRIQ